MSLRIRTFHFRSHSARRRAWANLPVKVPVPLQLSASTLVSLFFFFSFRQRLRVRARGRVKASRASSRKEVRFADAAQTPSTRISVPNNFCWRMQPEFPTFVVERSPLARLQHSIGRRLLRSLWTRQWIFLQGCTPVDWNFTPSLPLLTTSEHNVSVALRGMHGLS